MKTAVCVCDRGEEKEKRKKEEKEKKRRIQNGFQAHDNRSPCTDFAVVLRFIA